ncbi:Resolvase, N terminal domain [Bacillus sp. OK838]|nr:Resolvase, N terminal domain [Bacillus sp. OK838]
MSTLNQDSESEIQMLKKGCEVIYSEKFTGEKFDRPKFRELLSVLETGDTLVVKFDRFARSVKMLFKQLDGFL